MSKLIEVTKTFIGECWHGHYDRGCVYETLSKNCLHQKTIGKAIGIDSFLCDCHDWSEAFPDFTTQLVEIEEYRNMVICNIARSGTHLYQYKSTNMNKKTILTTSDFFTGIDNLTPKGLRYEQPAKVIFAFDRGKISQLIIEEDPTALSQQLGLIPRNDSPGRDYLFEIRLLEKTLHQVLGIALSEREMECLALGFCGFSAKHIGEILKLSHRTIETHFAHAYLKIGCSGKQKVLELMYERGLLALWLDLGKSMIVIAKQGSQNK